MAASSRARGGSQPLRRLALTQPLGGQGVGLVQAIGAEQDAQVLGPRGSKFGLLASPGSEVFRQVGPAALGFEQVGVRGAQGVRLAWFPAGFIRENALQPGVGSGIVAGVRERLGVLLLQASVIGPVGSELFLQAQHVLGLAYLLQSGQAHLGPVFHVEPVGRLPGV